MKKKFVIWKTWSINGEWRIFIITEGDSLSVYLENDSEKRVSIWKLNTGDCLRVKKLLKNIRIYWKRE